MYHCQLKVVSRGAGRSAPQASGYISGLPVRDEFRRQTYFRHKGGVLHAALLLPDGAPTSFCDRSVLWTAAERAEVYRNARVARELEVAIPWPLTLAQGIALVTGFAKVPMRRYGSAVDLAIHLDNRRRWDGADKGRDTYHAHILFSVRSVDASGLGKKIELELSDAERKRRGLTPAREEVRLLRKAWELCANHALDLLGHDLRLDSRSYRARGLSIEPTLHLGPKATRLSRAGFNCDRAMLNRRIIADRYRPTQFEDVEGYPDPSPDC